MEIKAYRNIVFYSVLLSVFVMIGCIDTDPIGSPMNHRFFGSWISDPFIGLEISFEFNNDGSVNMTGDINRSGTWVTHDDTLTMSFVDEADGYSFSGDYSFDFLDNDTTMTLLYNSVLLTLHKI